MKRILDIEQFIFVDNKDYLLPIQAFDWILYNADEFFRHWHKEYELTLICAGSGVYELNLVEYEVKEGDLIVIENEMLHYGYSTSDGFEAIVIIFDMEMYHSVLQDPIDTKFILPIINGNVEIKPVIQNAIQENPWLLEKFKHILELYRTGEAGFELQLKSGILEIIVFIFVKKHYTTQNYMLNQKQATVNAIKTILTYINENLQNEIYLDTLAQLVNFDKSYLSRFFKKHLGMTCVEYITGCRLNKASQLLLSTELSVTEIAYEVGFNNVSFFLKKFKERYGVTPNKFRVTS